MKVSNIFGFFCQICLALSEWFIMWLVCIQLLSYKYHLKAMLLSINSFLTLSRCFEEVPPFRLFTMHEVQAYWGPQKPERPADQLLLSKSIFYLSVEYFCYTPYSFDFLIQCPTWCIYYCYISSSRSIQGFILITLSVQTLQKIAYHSVLEVEGLMEPHSNQLLLLKG